MEVLQEFVSSDKKRRAVLKRNNATSFYEVDFYQGKKKVDTVSHGFHTRAFHESLIEEFLNPPEANTAPVA